MITSKIQNYPASLSGLALGLMSISIIWGRILHEAFIYVGMVIAVMIFILLTVKKLFYPAVLMREIKDPVIRTFLPTFDMLLMILSSVVVDFNPTLGKFMWLTGIVIHTIFFIIFVYYRCRHFHLEEVLPSWLIPGVGMVVACVTGSEMGMLGVSKFMFYWGFIVYIILLPIIFYRLLFLERMSNALMPSFGVVASAPNVCLAGYLTVFAEPNISIIVILAATSTFSTLLAYLSIIRVIQLPFAPIFASYTFPLAIGAVAVLKLSDYYHSVGNEILTEMFISMGFIQLVIATICTLYVLINMIIWIKMEVHEVRDIEDLDE